MPSGCVGCFKAGTAHGRSLCCKKLACPSGIVSQPVRDQTRYAVALLLQHANTLLEQLVATRPTDFDIGIFCGLRKWVMCRFQTKQGEKLAN